MTQSVGQPVLETAQATGDEAEQIISGDIDAILKRLDDGMPRLFDGMRTIQNSLRRPLAF